MIKLSERLECIANRIDKGETVADIGTDHGYLPIYLWENKISPKVIMADISKGSLQKAKDNCKLSQPDFDFDCRLGDGLEVLKPHEVDTVVMAGMGALLIIEMLEWDIIKTRTYKKFILQPRNNLGELVKWLKVLPVSTISSTRSTFLPSMDSSKSFTILTIPELSVPSP